MKFVLRKGAKNIFGPALRRAREQSPLKFTQSDLADYLTDLGLPIDRSAISRIENQERAITDIELMYFQKALRINFTRLIELHQRDPNRLPAYAEYKLEDDDLGLQVAERG